MFRDVTWVTWLAIILKITHGQWSLQRWKYLQRFSFDVDKREVRSEWLVRLMRALIGGSAMVLASFISEPCPLPQIRIRAS
jgi:hypothetical protein